MAELPSIVVHVRDLPEVKAEIDDAAAEINALRATLGASETRRIEAEAELASERAASAEQRSALLVALAEVHEEAVDYRLRVPNGDAAPDYADGLMSAWDDFRTALGIPV